MKTWLRVACVGAFLALPACFDSEPDLGRMHFYCQFDTDCLDGYACRTHPEGKYCTPVSEFVFGADTVVEDDVASEVGADLPQ